MSIIHFTRRLAFINTKLLCGTRILDRRYVTMRAVTQDPQEVTCKRCLAKLVAEPATTSTEGK